MWAHIECMKNYLTVVWFKITCIGEGCISLLTASLWTDSDWPETKIFKEPVLILIFRLNMIQIHCKQYFKQSSILVNWTNISSYTCFCGDSPKINLPRQDPWSFSLLVVVVFLLFLQRNICAIWSKTYPGIRWSVWTKMFIKSCFLFQVHIAREHGMVNIDKDVVNVSDKPKVESWVPFHS